MRSCHHCRGCRDWVGQGTAWARWASTLQQGMCTAPTCTSGPLPNTSMPLLYPLWVLISWSRVEKILGFRLGEGGFLFFVTGCSRQIMPRAFWPPWVYLKRKQSVNLTKVHFNSMKLLQKYLLRTILEINSFTSGQNNPLTLRCNCEFCAKNFD